MFVWKDRKINEKEAGVGPFFKKNLEGLLGSQVVKGSVSMANLSRVGSIPATDKVFLSTMMEDSKRAKDRKILKASPLEHFRRRKWTKGWSLSVSWSSPWRYCFFVLAKPASVLKWISTSTNAIVHLLLGSKVFHEQVLLSYLQVLSQLKCPPLIPSGCRWPNFNHSVKWKFCMTPHHLERER